MNILNLHLDGFEPHNQFQRLDQHLDNHAGKEDFTTTPYHFKTSELSYDKPKTLSSHFQPYPSLCLL